MYTANGHLSACLSCWSALRPHLGGLCGTFDLPQIYPHGHYIKTLFILKVLESPLEAHCLAGLSNTTHRCLQGAWPVSSYFLPLPSSTRTGLSSSLPRSVYNHPAKVTQSTGQGRLQSWSLALNPVQQNSATLNKPGLGLFWSNSFVRDPGWEVQERSISYTYV